jgi:hypothetical protein
MFGGGDDDAGETWTARTWLVLRRPQRFGFEPHRLVSMLALDSGAATVRL